MRRLTHLLLAFLLLGAQMLAAAHALEHAVEAEQLPPHACELCLAAHALGHAATAHVFAQAAVAADPIFTAVRHAGRASLPAPQARQQAPPYV